MPGELTTKQLSRLESYLVSESSLSKRIAEAKDQAPLRFNLPCVRASTIGAQYYCERKVEMVQLHGRVETEIKHQGVVRHEALQAGSVEEDRETILRRIFTGERVVVHEFPLIAGYRDVILAGQPDAILFRDESPLIVFEYKFSNSRIPYHSYHAQARVYCRMLEAAGFDTSDLYYAIAVAPRDSHRDETIFGKVIKIVNESEGETSLTVGGAYVYLYEYSRPDSEKDIDWALEYWRETRNSEPADNPVKCRSCEYREKCSNATQLAIAYTRQ